MSTKSRLTLIATLVGLILLFSLMSVESTPARGLGDAGSVPDIALSNPLAALFDPAAARFADYLQIQTPNACPAAPAGLPDSVELAGEEFCLFYDDAVTTLDQATRGAEHTADYWTAYVDDMGFPAPEYSAVAVKFHVRLIDNAGCNGSVSPGSSYTTVYDGCDSPAAVQPQMYQLVFGHETYHQVQLSDGGNDPGSNNFDALWFHEGTARSIEDKVFEIVDHWANAMAAPFSYNKEVNNYLVAPNNDITSDPMRYKSALWWTYFSEQCGAEMDETRRGVDAFGELWDSALTSDNIAALNIALSNLGCSNFDTMFRRFTVANWTKDLTGVPDDSYNYADEDEVGNPAPYGPLAPTLGGTINSGTSASFLAQAVTRYGASYYSATPSATDCEVITVDFHRTAGSTEFYHVVTQDGTAFQTHVEGSGADWTQSFLNDGITTVTAIIGGQNNAATVDVEFSCATPVIEIELPNQLAPAYVGNFNDPDNLVIQVSVTNGSPTGPVVGGLSNSDFSVEVGGLPALVLGGGFVQEEYFLRIDTPNQGGNGPYDLEVFLEEPGTATVIASDTENEAVVYDNTNNDHIIVTDVSGSMGWDGKLNAAQDAANLFIDASNSSEGLGLVSYHHDVEDTLPVEFGTLPHRTDAHTQVNNYIASGATSIGDGLDEAVNLLGASTTGNTRCQFTLLSDGMENSVQFWADVQAAVVATGCPVMTIAFGADSNELLMQDIATATGGISYYNDVYVSSTENPAGGNPADTDLELGDTYLYALCEAQECERIFAEKGPFFFGLEVYTHTMTADATVEDLTFVLDWTGAQTPGQPETPEGCNPDLDLTLISPTGTVYAPTQYAFDNDLSDHAGYHIPDAEAGEWQMIVNGEDEQYYCGGTYQVIAYGHTDSSVELLLASLEGGTTGDYIPLYAIWLPGGHVLARITAPDGTINTMQLFDDGQHGDGAADDGFFANTYTLVNQALESAPVDEEGVPNPPDPLDEGAYRVHLMATLDDIQREAQGSFAVLEGDDANNDGVPDDFIDTHCPGAPTSDVDLDLLDCSDEYFTGTDPNNSDTDGGGESDESEAIRHGLDPLDNTDDLVEAPDFVHTTAQNGSVLLTYDVKADYASMLAYRATSPAGPWTLISASLPLEGSYTDNTVTNDTLYYYCVQGINGTDHWTAVVCSESVEPREDPILPEAGVLINGGEPTTPTPNVVLTFVTTEEGVEGLSIQGTFDDITEVMLSNDPSFDGAVWQPFAQGIPWQLEPGPGLRTVYVRFMDENGNISAGAQTASIEVTGTQLLLPLIIR